MGEQSETKKPTAQLGQTGAQLIKTAAKSLRQKMAGGNPITPPASDAKPKAE